MDYFIVFGLGVIVAFVLFRMINKNSKANFESPEFDESWKNIEGTSFSYKFESRTYEEDSGPDNPRFANWHEAFNRNISKDEYFEIEYCDVNGEITNRKIRPISIKLIQSSPDVFVNAFCELRNEERTFLSSRILAVTNLKTNRTVKDLGQYLRSKY